MVYAFFCVCVKCIFLNFLSFVPRILTFDFASAKIFMFAFFLGIVCRISVFEFFTFKREKMKFESCQKRSVDLWTRRRYFSFFAARDAAPASFFKRKGKNIPPLKSSNSKLKRSFLRPRFQRFRSSRSHLLDFFNHSYTFLVASSSQEEIISPDFQVMRF